jgi:tight adherence protein C
MTVLYHDVVVMSGVGVASGTGCMLIAQLLRTLSHVRLPQASLPWFIRAFRIPGTLFGGAVMPFLTERHAGRIEQSLAAVELEGAFRPESWVGLRLVHATIVAILAALAALLIKMPIPLSCVVGVIAGYGICGLWMRSARRETERSIIRDLPSSDLLTVCVEAGATLTAGINQIIEQAPESPLRRYFEHVLREVRGGRLRAQAFEHVARLYAVPSLSTLAGALAHAESSGMSLGGILRAQGQQRIAERFARAERLAMQAPVKLLGPLILCIFPCTFVVLAVPIVVRLSDALAS